MTRVRLLAASTLEALEDAINAASAQVEAEGLAVKTVSYQPSPFAACWTALVTYGHGPTMTHRWSERAPA